MSHRRAEKSYLELEDCRLRAFPAVRWVVTHVTTTPRPPAQEHVESRRSRRLFFFFQAEDGIRDLTVTGVQTCALPISRHALQGQDDQLRDRLRALCVRPRRPARHPPGGGGGVHRALPRPLPEGQGDRKSVV